MIADMREQIVLSAEGGYQSLKRLLLESGCRHIFLVCGSSIRFLELDRFFRVLPEETGIQVTRFSGFSPNPDYENVRNGVGLFQRSGCDFVAAVGGGSAIDVAKCVKLWGRMAPGTDYLKQEPEENGIRLLAVPTTAGSGSEATRFAVIYRDGIKQSVTSKQCIPWAVLLDPDVLKPLPLYQRKAAMLDALCHAIESFWSVNANGESRELAQRAIRLFLSCWESYLRNEDSGNASMQQTAYLAGKAINITQTTAGHAMAYGLTTKYGLAHGQAAALCVAALWPYMAAHAQERAGLEETFRSLALAMGCESAADGIRCYTALLENLRLPRPGAREEDIQELARGVNMQRLKNNPIILGESTIEALYRKILL